MRAHRLSMSRMARAHVCAFPFRMDVEARERPSGKAARIGSLVHLLVERRVLGQDLTTPEDADPHEAAEASCIFHGPLSGWLESTTWTAVEAGLIYYADSDTTADGPRRGEPRYGEVGGMTLPGTLDLVRVEPERIVLRDVKSGKPPTDREQLYAQAVAASRRWGKNVVEIGYTRALKTKVEELDVETLDADRLDEEAGRIARVLRRLPTAEPVVNDKCDWCDAKGACPAFMAEPPKDLKEAWAADDAAVGQ